MLSLGNRGCDKQMWYMGGKHRQSKALKAILTTSHGADHSYYEPFCGAMGAASAIAPHFNESVLSDASLPLITMWKALRQGWVPPLTVDEETYARYAAKRHNPDCHDPMTAYCGYAMSFGGKWFGGFARSGAGIATSQANQRKAVLRKIEAIRESSIVCLDYREVAVPDKSVVYLDPPYQSRTKPHHNGTGFNHETFWQYARDLSWRCYVYATEFNAPDDWTPVHTWGDTVVRHGGKAGVTGQPVAESLFILRGGLNGGLYNV